MEVPSSQSGSISGSALSSDKQVLSPLCLTNACSADLRGGTDCVEKRELHRDVLFDATNTEIFCA